MVQSQKFCFDLYGDTVTEALQLEREAKPGEVVVSEAALAEIPDRPRSTLPTGSLRTRTGTPLGYYQWNAPGASEIEAVHGPDA